MIASATEILAAYASGTPVAEIATEARCSVSHIYNLASSHGIRRTREHGAKDRAAAVVRVSEGATLTAVAESIGVRRATLARWCKDADVESGASLAADGVTMLQAGLSVKEVAADLGVTEGAVYKWLRRHGLRPAAATRRERGMALLREGHAPRDIAAELDVSAGTIRNWRTRLTAEA